MSKDIDLNINLRKDGAKAAAEELRAEVRDVGKGMVADAAAAEKQEVAAAQAGEKEKLGAAVAAGAREKAIGAEQLRETKARHSAEVGAARDANAEKVRLTQGFAQVTKQSHAEAVAGFGQVGKSGKVAFGDVSLAAGLAGIGIYKMIGLARELGAEFDKVGAKSRGLSAAFATDRDRLREVAAVEGRTPDTAFTLELHRKAREAAMTFGEAADFRTAFANETAAYKGTKLGDKEYQEYMDKVALDATRANVTGRTAALFGGSFLTRDLRGFGDQAAEEAFRAQHQVAKVYETGQGSNEQNYGAFAALKKQYEPGTFASPFKSDVELATVGSVANAAGADKQEEQVENLVRVLRETDNEKLNALFVSAGVPLGMKGTSLLETIRKIAPVLQARSQQTGLGLDQVVGDIVPDMRARRALAIQIQQGVVGGQYEQRAGVATQSGVAGAGEKANADFLKSEVGAERVAVADAKLAEAERAAKNSELTTLRHQAAASLLRAGAIDTNVSAVSDFVLGKSTFGMMGDAEQTRIDLETERMIMARSPGGKRPGTAADLLNFTPEARETQLRGYIEGLKNAGMNPLVPAQGEAEVTARPPGTFGKEGGRIPFGAGAAGYLDDLKSWWSGPAPGAKPKPKAAPEPVKTSMNLPEVFPGEGKVAGPQLAATEGKIPGFGMQGMLAASVLGALPSPAEPEFPPVERPRPTFDTTNVGEARAALAAAEPGPASGRRALALAHLGRGVSKLDEHDELTHPLSELYRRAMGADANAPESTRLSTSYNPLTRIDRAIAGPLSALEGPAWQARTFGGQARRVAGRVGEALTGVPFDEPAPGPLPFADEKQVGDEQRRRRILPDKEKQRINIAEAAPVEVSLGARLTHSARDLREGDEADHSRLRDQAGTAIETARGFNAENEAWHRSPVGVKTDLAHDENERARAELFPAGLVGPPRPDRWPAAEAAAPVAWEDDDGSDVIKAEKPKPFGFLDWQKDPGAEKAERAQKHLAFLEGRKRGGKGAPVPAEKAPLSPLASFFSTIMPEPEPLRPSKHEAEHTAMLDRVAAAQYGEQGKALGAVHPGAEAKLHRGQAASPAAAGPAAGAESDPALSKTNTLLEQILAALGSGATQRPTPISSPRVPNMTPIVKRR